MNKTTKPSILDIDKLINHMLSFNDKATETKKNISGDGQKTKLPFRFEIKTSILNKLAEMVLPKINTEPNLLNIKNVNKNLYVFGDIHGQFSDLIRFINMADLPPHANMLFLGDYVDRGFNSIEVITLLFALKIKYPSQVHLLRGNHECSKLNNLYGFSEECTSRYGEVEGLNIWKNVNKVLSNLPLAALINNEIFCIHGGIPQKLGHLNDINKIQRGTHIPDSGLLCDLTWSDPKKTKDKWESNDRGVSHTFNELAVNEFVKQHNISLICRGHQVVPRGYKFFANQKLITVFSAPNYCGNIGNDAAVMCISPQMKCSFLILKPINPKNAKKAYSLSALPQL